MVEASYAMPDVHWGYGFPIGGVAATDVAGGGGVSPGGVGFDISCGVRLLAAGLDRNELAPVLGRVMDGLAAAIPRGAGRGGVSRLRGRAEMEKVLLGGAAYAVEKSHGTGADLDRREDHSVAGDADPAQVSARAIDRGLHQVGSLGSGNHFLEIQAVAEISDPAAAEAFGLADGQVCVMIHCGSRGLGHQICSDHVQIMDRAMGRYGIAVPDRQLACAPADSPEGRGYLGAMAAAANYGQANRQLLTEAARRVFARTADTELDLVYDVSHNLATIETHQVERNPHPALRPPERSDQGAATRPSRPPAGLADAGQPVLVPGSMGTSSYVLAGVTGGGAFFSACHGAGRVMSRHQAARSITGPELRQQLEDRGIAVRGVSARGLAEETPDAYKDVTQAVAAAEGAGLCRKVARLVPLGVVKG